LFKGDQALFDAAVMLSGCAPAPKSGLDRKPINDEYIIRIC